MIFNLHLSLYYLVKSQAYRTVQSLIAPSASDQQQRQAEQQLQKLTLGVERFALPELLFNPSDVEINQMGVVVALYASLKRMPMGWLDLKIVFG